MSSHPSGPYPSSPFHTLCHGAHTVCPCLPLPAPCPPHSLRPTPAPGPGPTPALPRSYDLPSPSVAVRNLVEHARFGHLCTVMSGMHHRRAGYPFGTLVDFASDGAGG